VIRLTRDRSGESKLAAATRIGRGSRRMGRPRACGGDRERCCMAVMLFFTACSTLEQGKGKASDETRRPALEAYLRDGGRATDAR
jgi:hypothetical protein